MSGKVRRIDFYPDEYIAGVGGVLRAEDQGVYWMICSLITSQGGAIDFNERRISGLCLMRPADLRKSVDRLIEKGKITLTGDGKLFQKRAQSELEKSAKRIQSAAENGANGGRPSKKTDENQSNDKAAGSFGEKLTNNQQPATSNTSLRSVAPAAPKPKPHRLSVGWKLPEEARKWALEKGVSSDWIATEVEKIINWSINSKNGAKLDWFAAWRNWVQKALEDRPIRGSPFSAAPLRGLAAIEERLKRDIENEQDGSRSLDSEIDAGFPLLAIADHRGQH